MSGSPFSEHPGGVSVSVYLTPKAARPTVGPIVAGATGNLVKARVAAPPEDGKANAELCRALAREWDVPKSAVHVTTGASSRHKIVRVDGEPAQLMPRLAAWGECHHG